ncbi:hypothetical protein NHX12_010619 [Muraenolepis orangiensis]|uniref:Uncharacterized protein n=1 Tax=Muraenolepis orangiensis TaxID=630683 RepID=A0A9Q0DK56_9TELE|nr:hypothetical protein NHX12_010619 [Muraenolepis orangiensis]
MGPERVPILPCTPWDQRESRSSPVPHGTRESPDPPLYPMGPERVPILPCTPWDQRESRSSPVPHGTNGR